MTDRRPRYFGPFIGILPGPGWAPSPPACPAYDATEPRVKPRLEDLGCDLFTDKDMHDLFMSMISAQISNVLSANLPVENAAFTVTDRDELASLVQQQMKRAINQRKHACESDLYTLSTGEVLAMYRQIDSAAVTISVLGAGFTFSTIFSNLPEPHAASSREQVKLALTIAWLLFVLAILVASFVSALQATREKVVLFSFRRWRLVVGWLLLGAFVASAEAVRAYQPAIGIVIFVIAGVLLAVTLFLRLCAELDLVKMRRELRKKGNKPETP